MRILRGIEDACSTAAVLAFIAMVLITISDAALRYAFNSPLTWSFTVVANYLMAATFVLGLSETQRLYGHITMEVVRDSFSNRGYAASSLVASVVGCAFCVLIAASNFPLFTTAIANDERVASAMDWPLWPSYIILPIAFALSAVRFGAQAAQAVIALSTGAALPRVAHGESGGVE